MKNTYFVIAIIVVSLGACNNSSNKKSTENKNSLAHMSEHVSPFTSPVNGILHIYLQMKNDFVDEDDKAVANAGNEMLNALNDFDTLILRENERKSFQDIASDMKKNAEQIGANPGNINHQREHFDMLSKDIYDLVKITTAGEKIYVDFCPIYNDNKGATWLSETKEIENPYLGKEMDTCGSIKEELN